MLTQTEAMIAVEYGGTVTRRSWFMGAVVYFDQGEGKIVKVYADGVAEVYYEQEDRGSDDWGQVQ